MSRSALRMRTSARMRIGLALIWISLCPVMGFPAQAETTGVEVFVTSPRTGTVVRNRTDVAPLVGYAEASGRPSYFDVMLVVDVSESTEYPSGIDVDGDGVLGEEKPSLLMGLTKVKNTDPEDSVLAAEVSAGRALLDGLEPTRVRIGVVSFSGEVDPATLRRRSALQVDAILDQPLTDDYERVRQSLDAVFLRGPNGGTNMEAGIKLALRELASLSGAHSQPRHDAKKVILFLTDGRPSLPFGQANVEDPEDIEATLDAARLAKAAGVTMNVYGMGRGAADFPVAATEAARLTGGLYVPVRRPGDIVAMLTGVSFANVEDVVAVNLTIGEMAGPDDILLLPDGSFQGFVPVRTGANRIRVSALASDGSRSSTELDIIFRHQDLTDAELQAELERIRKRNRELQLVMERKRQEQFRKQERKRALELEVDDDKENRNSEESQP